MKIAIAGGAALVLGLGVGSIVSGNGVKNGLLEEAAQLAADSAAAHEADHDEAPALDPVAHVPSEDAGDHSGAALAVEDEPVVAAASSEAQLPVEPNPYDVLLAAAADSAAERARIAEEGARKLAQIFGAMQAQDAANVLQEMSDVEIEMILKHMNDRLAAQILGVFEPQRAASLSRAVLGLSLSEGG